MTNADKFKSLFGLYATELWAMPEKDFLKWLNSEAMNCSEFPNNSDTISRRAAIDALRKMQTYKLFSGDDMLLIDQAGAMTELMLLPPAEPKRGKWIKLDMHRGMEDHKCSVCEQECYVPTCMGEPMYAYCPNCGSYNGGEYEI